MRNILVSANYVLIQPVRSLLKNMPIAMADHVAQAHEGEKQSMQEIPRWSASLLTILPGIVIAARLRPALIGWAFVGLTAGAPTWIVVEYLAKDYALLAQSIAIGATNVLGLYRWLIWKGRVVPYQDFVRKDRAPPHTPRGTTDVRANWVMHLPFGS